VELARSARIDADLGFDLPPLLLRRLKRVFHAAQFEPVAAQLRPFSAKSGAAADRIARRPQTAAKAQDRFGARPGSPPRLKKSYYAVSKRPRWLYAGSRMDRPRVRISRNTQNTGKSGAVRRTGQCAI